MSLEAQPRGRSRGLSNILRAELNTNCKPSTHSFHHGRQKRRSTEDRGGDDKLPSIRHQHYHHNRDGVVADLNHDVLQPVGAVAGTCPAKNAGRPRIQDAVSAGGRNGRFPCISNSASPPEDAPTGRIGRRPVQRTPRPLRTRILSTVGYISPGFLRPSHARGSGEHDPAQRRVLAGLSLRSADPAGARPSEPEHRMGSPIGASPFGDDEPPAVPGRDQATGTDGQGRESSNDRGTGRTRRRREQRRRNRERRRKQSSPAGSEQCPSCGGSGRAGARPRDQQWGDRAGGSAGAPSRGGGTNPADARVHCIPGTARASPTGSMAGKPPTSVYLRLGGRIPEFSGVSTRV